MNLLTLKGLESGAKKKFEAQADEIVLAIARLEGVSYDELRPHIISLCYISKHSCWVFFDIPQHTPIRFQFTIYDELTDNRDIIKLKDDKLIVEHAWFAYRTRYWGESSFHRCDNLGHALLVARWAYEQDERAKWII